MNGESCPVRAFPTRGISPLDVDPVLREVHALGGVGRLEYPFGGSCYVFTAADAVTEIYLSDALSRKGMSVGSAPRLTENILIDGGIGATDGETHSRWRRAVNDCLDPRRMRVLEELARDKAQTLAEHQSRVPGGNFVEEFSRPFSLAVLGGLLGFGPEKHGILTNAVTAMLSTGLPYGTQSSVDEALTAIGSIVIEMVECRRTEPRDDFTSDLMRSSIALEDWEVITIVFSLIAAGFDSSTHILTKIVHELLHDHELRDTLANEPSLVGSAVEEYLRLVPLAGGVALPFRVDEPTTIGGRSFGAGEYVVPGIGVSNRDGGRFRGAEEMDLFSATNKHFSFGFGKRYCLGARVARMELVTAIRHFVESYPAARVVDGSVEWSDSTAVRRISRMTVDLGGKND